MRIRQHVAQALGDALEARLQLGQKPVVLHAPPNAPGEYPALAIWLEKAELAIAQDTDLEVDSAGALIAGSAATSPTGDVARGNVATLSSGITLSHLGTIRCQGRIWAGSRYAAKRLDIEDEVFLAFLQDRSAPGRLLFDLAGADLGKYSLPFGTAAAMVESSTWTNEFAFAERLWSWIRFSLDVPLLVPRTDVIVTQLLLSISKDLSTLVDDPTDLNKLTDLETFTVTSTSP